MAIRNKNALRLQPGDEIVIRADVFFISTIESPISKIAFNIVELDDANPRNFGARVHAVLTEGSMPMLRSAVLEASRRFPNRRERLVRFFQRIIQRLPFKRTNRIRKGELRTIRADKITTGTLKNTDEARVQVIITQTDGGVVCVPVPDRILSELATVGFKAIRIARSPIQNTEEPEVNMVSSGIIPDQMSVLAPNRFTPPGHTTIQIWIGGVPLEISAQTSAWTKLLKSLPR